MLDTELVSRAFVRFSGPKLLGVLHKAENDIYERLGEISMEDDLQRALELADDVDHLVMAINLHLGFAAGRASASLRGATLDATHSVPNCTFAPSTVSELMSILASLYSVLLDVTIGFSRNETDCANKLRVLVQRILTTFSPTYNIPRFPSEKPSKLAVCADIRLLDVIAQAERITSLRNTATLLPLFDTALLSVKRLFSNSPIFGKKAQQSEQEVDIETCTDSVAIMLKAIVVVRIAKRIFSRHALRHLRALHASNGVSFPPVSIPLLTAINSSPYASELPESAHSSVDELRSFLLDYTSCTDELMERILFYLNRSSPSPSPTDEEELQHDSSAENEFVDKATPVVDDMKEEDLVTPEKRRRVSSRSTGVGTGDTALFVIDRLRNSDVLQATTDLEASVDLEEDDDVELVAVDDSDVIDRGDEADLDGKGDDEGDEDDGDDDNIPLDQLRHRRPKSVDSTLSASWASCSMEQSSDLGLAESSAAPSPSSNSTTTGVGAGSHSTANTDAESSSGGNVRRSARLSSKIHSRTSGVGSNQ